MRKRRGSQGSQTEGSQNTTSESSTESVTSETVPECYAQGITGKFKSLPERPRFVTLSDGQVLDRSVIVPGHASGDFMQRMRYCNEAEYNYHPNTSNKEMVKAIIKAGK